MKGESPVFFSCPLDVMREWEGWHFWMPCLALLSASATPSSSHGGFITVRVSKRHALGQHLRTAAHANLGTRDRMLILDSLDGEKFLQAMPVQG